MIVYTGESSELFFCFVYLLTNKLASFVRVVAASSSEDAG